MTPKPSEFNFVLMFRARHNAIQIKTNQHIIVLTKFQNGKKKDAADSMSHADFGISAQQLFVDIEAVMPLQIIGNQFSMLLQCFCSSQSPAINPSFEGPCEYHTLDYQTTRTKCSTAEISDINKLRMRRRIQQVHIISSSGVHHHDQVHNLFVTATSTDGIGSTVLEWERLEHAE